MFGFVFAISPFSHKNGNFLDQETKKATFHWPTTKFFLRIGILELGVISINGLYPYSISIDASRLIPHDRIFWIHKFLTWEKQKLSKWCHSKRRVFKNFKKIRKFSKIWTESIFGLKSKINNEFFDLISQILLYNLQNYNTCSLKFTDLQNYSYCRFWGLNSWYTDLGSLK